MIAEYKDFTVRTFFINYEEYGEDPDEVHLFAIDSVNRASDNQVDFWIYDATIMGDKTYLASVVYDENIDQDRINSEIPGMVANIAEETDELIAEYIDDHIDLYCDGDCENCDLHDEDDGPVLTKPKNRSSLNSQIIDYEKLFDGTDPEHGILF